MSTLGSAMSDQDIARSPKRKPRVSARRSRAVLFSILISFTPSAGTRTERWIGLRRSILRSHGGMEHLVSPRRTDAQPLGFGRVLERLGNARYQQSHSLLRSHQLSPGLNWPLFTGWVSLAEYRAGRPLAGYTHLMQNADLTWTQDLGAVTELLSGDLFQPLGRSSSHQMWSSAMVISPVVRGLLGLDWDAPNRTLIVRPQLPGNWDHVRVHNVPLGSLHLELDITRQAGELIIQATSSQPEHFCLSFDARLPPMRRLRCPHPRTPRALASRRNLGAGRTARARIEDAPVKGDERNVYRNFSHLQVFCARRRTL